MQIVIEIDDELYEEILSRKYSKTKLEKAVADGEPLLSGHGRLIDESDLIPDSDYENGMFYAVSIGAISGAPTIIEADVPEADVGKMAESEG